MKRVISLLCAMLIVLGCAGCSMRGRANNVIRFIQQDQQGMEACAQQILETGSTADAPLFDGVEHIEYIAPGWVAFVTGSREENGVTIACGFYYAPEDTPLGYQGEEMELAAFSDGYQHLYEDGMEYYTERVLPNWYFYEYNVADDREENPFLQPQL